MLYELGIIFFLSLSFIWLLQKKAESLGLIDIPNARSVHQTNVAKGAGIAFYFSVMIVIPFFHLDLILSHLLVTFAIFIVFVVGLLDDYYEMSPKTKFIVIIFATILLYFEDLVIDNIGIFFGVDISMSWFALPFTIFAVSGFTNALNLIDGLDGLAATTSIIIMGSFFILGYHHNDTFMMLLSSTFLVSVLAFIFFNWYPATIFMGDSGSLTLGFVISILAIQSLEYIPTVSILFIAAIPILDTVIVMFRRKLSGGSAFEADSYHMHHLLKHYFKGSTQKTVVFLGLLQAIYSFIALQFDKGIDEGILLFIFILNGFLLYILLNRMKKKQVSEI